MHARFIEKHFSLQTIGRLTDIGLVSQEFNKKKNKQNPQPQVTRRTVFSSKKKGGKTKKKSYIATEDKVS